MSSSTTQQIPMPKVRFGQYLTVLLFSLGAGNIIQDSSSSVTLPIHHLNLVIPSNIALAVMAFSMIVLCYWCEMAEAHEGKGIPSTMTPPSEKDLLMSAPSIVDASSDSGEDDEDLSYVSVTASESSDVSKEGSPPVKGKRKIPLVWREVRGGDGWSEAAAKAHLPTYLTQSPPLVASLISGAW